MLAEAAAVSPTSPAPNPPRRQTQRSPGSHSAPAIAEKDAAFAQDSILRGGGFAPDIFPVQQSSNNGITVQGYASATADADSAIVEFYFYTNGPGAIEPLQEGRAVPDSAGGGSDSSAPQPQQAEPITEATLQPVIDALTGAGVPRDQIEFIGAYADLYSSSATLRATVTNLDSLDAVVQAGTNAAAGLGSTFLQNTNVSYTVGDCAALESAAMKAAVEDANERGAAFAQTLGVGLGSIVGASNYSYFGGTPCDSRFFKGPYPIGGVGYFQGQPREVQVFANIGVTYAIQ